MMRVVNGLITIICFPLLFNLYLKKKRRFFLFWGVGFLLYGITVLLNGLLPEATFAQIYPYVFFVSTSGFFFIIVGLGELIDKTRVIFSGTFIVPAILLFYNLVSGNWRDLVWFIVISPYLFIVLSLIFIMLVHDYDLKMLFVGWSILLIINLISLIGDPGSLPGGLFALLSVVATGLIYLGMIKPSFVFIVDDLTHFMKAGNPMEPKMDNHGQFILVRLDGSSKNVGINWIKNRVDYNTNNGVRTIIISYYDILSTQDFLHEIDSDLVYFVKVQMGSHVVPLIFENQITTISDDLNQLGLVLSEIIKTSIDNQAPFELILYSLSTVIHTQGWKRMYSFLISLIPLIKNNQILLTAFIHPKSHQESSEVSKFEHIADSIIQL